MRAGLSFEQEALSWVGPAAVSTPVRESADTVVSVKSPGRYWEGLGWVAVE